MRAPIAVFLVCSLYAPSAGAQESNGAVESEPSYFEVVGLAPNDLLNVRAIASPAGMMIGRLPPGALVRNLGCADVAKNRWCKIADVNNERFQGWVAARYLVGTSLVDGGEEILNEDGSTADGDILDDHAAEAGSPPQ